MFVVEAENITGVAGHWRHDIKPGASIPESGIQKVSRLRTIRADSPS